MNVTITEGDLLDEDVDVIVNAWNRNIIPWWLLLPQGISGAIKKRGGTPLTRTAGLQVYAAVTNRLPKRVGPPGADKKRHRNWNRKKLLNTVYFQH
jgi:O-acetyl-ADP-ribose deacetylase (regulator of RNase III)